MEEDFEVLVHLNVRVRAQDGQAAKVKAVSVAVDAANESREAFEALIALVDPT
jgi:hypothetical protein